MTRPSEPSVCVIVSTYNSPVHLLNCLRGFAEQTESRIELIVADDGSAQETRDLVDEFGRSAPFPVRHVWHQDDGFRKPAILNKAIKTASAPYLLFTDGDCIPRNDFVAVHLARARKGFFLSGGVEYLSPVAQSSVSGQAIADQRLFDPNWLSSNREKAKLVGKVSRSRLVTGLARRLTTTRPTFNGHNASVWKDDIVAVNGFDERMVYGGLDRELGERLAHNGIKGLSVRYDAIAVHQHHARPYATEPGWQANNVIRQEGRARRAVWTDWGLKKTAVQDVPPTDDNGQGTEDGD